MQRLRLVCDVGFVIWLTFDTKRYSHACKSMILNIDRLYFFTVTFLNTAVVVVAVFSIVFPLKYDNKIRATMCTIC